MEGYIRCKVGKTHDKFGKTDFNKLEHKQVPKWDGTRCVEGLFYSIKYFSMAV